VEQGHLDVVMVDLVADFEVKVFVQLVVELLDLLDWHLLVDF
jgi:hypothetical protein